MRASVQATAFLADPSGSSPLVAASRWLEATVLGSVATIVAVLCVASVGFLMLSGRLDARRGITVVIGSFILFGSPAIVRGLMGIDGDQEEAPIAPAPMAASAVPLPIAVPPPYDPYAGASVGPR